MAKGAMKHVHFGLGQQIKPVQSIAGPLPQDRLMS